MYAAKVLADSVSPAGHRLTSFEVTFPRIVLAEVNTHCMLARNSASSRAIPVAKRIAAIESDPFMPEAFGRNQKGMQPGDALDGDEDAAARFEWEEAMNECVRRADNLASLNVHKQYANRLLEPFSWHTAVITATDWDNFFHLRINPAAQGEFRRAAEMMFEAREKSEPCPINFGDWHTPYVDAAETFNLLVYGVDVAGVSAARCARVSYLTQDGKRDTAKDLELYGRLLDAGHMSPLEHPARPMTEFELYATEMFDVGFDGGPALRVSRHSLNSLGFKPEVGMSLVRPDENNIGVRTVITSVRGPLHYSGKFNGWISRRAHVPGEHDILGHRAQS